MKHCPVCGASYDEEIIRFCTKDGTPLIEDAAPAFTAMPSESIDAADEDEFGMETVITRKPEPGGGQPIAFDEHGRSERIVIPTEHTPTPPQQVRPLPNQGYRQPVPTSNTTRTVVLTILGTVAVLALGAAIFWGLQKDTPKNANINVNANQNTNLNTNLSFDSNFNFNAAPSPSNLNTNFNAISNLNSNISTRPSPSPISSPRPSPSPSPIRTALPTPSDDIETRPTPANTRPTPNANAAPIGTPRTGPRPPPIGNRTPNNSNN